MSDTEAIDIDPALAAAMGFSGFGAQPSAKKRKFKHDDAVVDGVPPKPAKSGVGKKGTGANVMELGVRERRKQGSDGGGPAVVRDVAAQADGEGAELGSTGSAAPEAAGTAQLAGPGVAAAPTGKAKATAPPTGMAHFLAQAHSQTPSAAPTRSSTEQHHTVLPAHPSLPSKPAPVASDDVPAADRSSRTSYGALSRQELDALRRGVRNARGDVAFFMPSFVEDPWAGLLAG
ncbi:hypothetical protein B0A49_11402 [Cryomyces minteri]|uniref:Uncharacterized protein n=1 Tax=Cryomyces minteri TaxID=331657 RepID=A0A4U0VQJ3_9PEZI|nr:hypothetical protein B0A49_11402 [Cryomyces minteri]